MLKRSLKKLIAKNSPEFIVVMNDVSQATMKEAVISVLKHKYAVKGRIATWKKGEMENFLLGTKDASFFAKCRRAKQLYKSDSYPKLFVLEGQHMQLSSLKYLMELGVKLKLVVIDDLTDSVGASFLASSVSPDGYLLLNADKKVLAMRRKTRAQVVTYGVTEKANIQAHEIKIQQTLHADGVNIEGMTFKMKIKGNFIPVMISGLLGKEAVYTALASMSCGVAYGLNPLDIANSLKTFNPLGGRMRVLGGIKHTILIDDTFESDFDSASEALGTMAEIKGFPEKKKIAVISSLVGLGNKTATLHKQLGELVAKAGFTHFICTGEQGTYLANGAKEGEMNEKNVYVKEEVETAGKFLQDLMKKGDIVFFDGHEDAHSEKMVKEVMAEPLKANAMLARSYEAWKM